MVRDQGVGGSNPLPDQYFQRLKLRFWFFRHTTVDECGFSCFSIGISNQSTRERLNVSARRITTRMPARKPHLNRPLLAQRLAVAGGEIDMDPIAAGFQLMSDFFPTVFCEMRTLPGSMRIPASPNASKNARCKRLI